MEKRFIKKLIKYDSIIIYGAGLVGGITAKRLLANQLVDKIIGFAVSKRTNAKDVSTGIKIYEIDELQRYKENTLIIIATMPVLHNEIREILEKKKFQYVEVVTADLYESFCKNYIADFQEKNHRMFPQNVKQRILFMASDNNRTSGAFLCMIELCEMLKERGISILIVLPQYGTGEELLIQRNLRYTYIPSKDWGYEVSEDKNLCKKIYFAISRLTNYRAKTELVKIIREQSVQLVHCNTTYTYIGAVAARACGIPFVWHLRENMENQGYRIFGEKTGLKLMRKASQIIAVSEYIKNVMKEKIAGPITVIYDAVEAEKSLDKGRNVFNRPITQMLIVGAIVSFKGQMELIKACDILVKKGIMNFHLQIVGAGEKQYIEKLKKQVETCNLEKYISFYGVCSNVFELYGRSDIAFTCGAMEAYGRVTIEAMLSGCLAVGVNTGATPELIKDGETGLLYQAGNVESLAECIEEALSNPERSRRLAKSGQVYVSHTFTKENNLRQILKVYQEALNEKRNKS